MGNEPVFTPRDTIEVWTGGDSPAVAAIVTALLPLAEICEQNGAADAAMVSTWSDSFKLRILALWLDRLDDVLSTAPNAGIPVGREAQDDLRRIAARLDSDDRPTYTIVNWAIDSQRTLILSVTDRLGLTGTRGYAREHNSTSWMYVKEDGTYGRNVGTRSYVTPAMATELTDLVRGNAQLAHIAEWYRITTQEPES